NSPIAFSYSLSHTFSGQPSFGTPGYQPISVPNANPTLAPYPTYAFGINDSGKIVGDFIDGSGTHGFVYAGGHFTTIDVPHAFATEVRGIDNAGNIVGDFTDSDGVIHGFLLPVSSNTFMTIDVPDVQNTKWLGIDGVGNIVGTYNSHGQT